MNVDEKIQHLTFRDFIRYECVAHLSPARNLKIISDQQRLTPSQNWIESLDEMRSLLVEGAGVRG
jgi:hypothetical protein